MADVKEEAVQVGMRLRGWVRWTEIISGIIAIIAALIVFASPTMDPRTIAVTLGIGVLLIGIDRLITGLSGRPLRPAAIERRAVPT